MQIVDSINFIIMTQAVTMGQNGHKKKSAGIITRSWRGKFMILFTDDSEVFTSRLRALSPQLIIGERKTTRK
jgi:hypothetical protein